MTGNAEPLAGVRIVEMDAMGPVPFAATMLADMGADVVRIVRAGHSARLGAALTAGRSAVSLDLKQAGDRKAAEDLVARADALIEGFRPGVMERLGLGPDSCLGCNPALVYARVTGWGQEGPMAPRAGHDINYISLTGVLHAIGPADRPPPPPLNLLGDYGGGAMFALAGILAGIISARETGCGRVVDVAMMDGVSMLSSVCHTLSATGGWRNKRGSNTLDGGAPFYRCYACADGKFVAVGALEPQFFAELLDGLDIASERFVQRDRTCWAEMESVFSEAFAAHPRSHWEDKFAERDACVTPVLSFDEAPGHPHAIARSSFQAQGNHCLPAPAPRFGAKQHRKRAKARTETVSSILSRWG